jgi:NAD(P)-dependent dehydrogenase (short-subunit alcohol dehydrogenase family)
MGLLSALRDRVLDASIFLSFDRSGFRRHAGDFDPADLQVDLSGRRVLVTGANAGLGRAATDALAGLGAEVWLLCRSEERGRRAAEAVRRGTGSGAVRLEIVDVADLASVRAFAGRLGERPVHALVHNAGVLPPERRITDDGLELTWATHVVGPFLLTRLLVPNLRAAGPTGGGRVVFVTSGGMYTRRLNLSDLDWRQRSYDGVIAYAESKRAQVVLTELWAERLEGQGVDVNAVHPGWADTPGVRDSLPRFWRLTRNRLRTPRQGADTIVWLVAAERPAGTTGELFFDRRPVPTHLLPWTRESAGDRRELWETCRRQAGGGEKP